ncbi:hypothetical protein GCK72_024112 [Caenorhabditis remanei]|uniref:DUF38 domain-containing protein n=1 Tax=Caenorhabditis remanei TaxID=31234 RepID=A0A6A5FYK5_CAERE|nr:hypothetical protein GCK72_024112 [Caenorhabditis remanei]KAF1747647.1 hypothetical protein GCK72_024112 [Caenorhabditis remanei]
MSEERNDLFMKQRLAFVKLLVDSEPEETWRLFCQALPEITDEHLDAWSQSSQKNKIKETINNEPQDVPPTVSGTGNNSNQYSHTLTTIGGDMLKEIVELVDIKTKKALQLTCKKLLNFIDENWKLNEVHIHLDYHKVKVRILSFGKKEELKFNDRKRKLQDDDQESNSSQKCFLQETADKFEEIIQNPKTQLGKLFITCTNKNDMAKKQEKLLHLIFDKIKKPICVESLKIDLPCSNALESILRKVKVGSLTELRLYHFSTDGSDDSAVTNIIENRHWVHIKKFTVIGCAPNSRMIAFKDMATISVRYIKNVTLDEILEYKNALLIGQGHLRHTFYGRFNVEEIAEKLMPYEELGEINKTKGMFRREDGTQLEFELTEDEISFSG